MLYENKVTESYGQSNLAFPVVAIYPKEGTFGSDHPIGIVDRDWVTPEHRDAAKTTCLTDYQNPVPLETPEFQIRLAVTEASDLGFVPNIFRAKGIPPPRSSPAASPSR